MSKGFTIALVAALVVVPCTAVMSFAEESKTETKQGCCDKNKHCDKDDKCSACKCKDCTNPDCDSANCSCEGCDKTACKCTSTACARCDESSCQSDANSYASCSQAGCANGKCRGQSSCDALALGASPGGCECSGGSALSIKGLHLFATPSATPDAAWQIIADEICHAPTQSCMSNASGNFVYLIFDREDGGDHAIRTECDQDSTVSSVLRGAALPHPVNYASAEIAVHRNRSVSDDDATTIKAEEQVLPVRWNQATGQPTKCTDYALQPNDLLRVRVADSCDATPHAIATAYTEAAPEASGNFVQGWRQRESADENATHIQYSIQIIEDRRGCLGEYEELRNGSPIMFAESKTLLPAIRMLQKNQVIRQLSSPKIICEAGQTAQMEISDGASEKSGEIWLEVAADKAQNGLMVELAVSVNRNCAGGTELIVEPGQTIVLNMNDGDASRDEKEQNEPAVYVVLTPEIVK